MTQDLVSHYEGMLDRMWRQMALALGVHTMVVVAQKAMYMTALKHSDASKLVISESGTSLIRLREEADADQVLSVVDEYVGSIVSVISRLVGLDISRRIAQDIDTCTRETGGR